MTEIDHCPLTGDRPRAPGELLAGPMEDALADHWRRVLGAGHWTREPDGDIRMWGEA